MKQTPKKAENILREGIDIIEENARLKRELKEQQKEIEKFKKTNKELLNSIFRQQDEIKDLREKARELQEYKKKFPHLFC